MGRARRQRQREALSVTIAARRNMPDLAARAAALAPWFHNIELAPGLWTAPAHFLGDYPRFKFDRFAHLVPADLTGRTVLDIGCNAGFYTMEMARRGADRVVGIDSDPRYLAQAALAAEALGFVDRIELRQLDVYDVAALGERFDLVIFMGVLYHLRHPLLALDLIHAHAARDLMLFQTLQRGSRDTIDVPEDHPFYAPGTLEPPPLFDEPAYPKLHFIERQYAQDWTNWWAPNRACAEAMLRAAGFAIETAAVDEDGIYLCRRTDLPFAEWGNRGAVYPARGKPHAA
jgi:tRNA (mo5U34)-methyltransferase